MRKINVEVITKTVKELCMEANYYCNEDIRDALIKSKKTEESPIGSSILDQIIQNADIASRKKMPICQDTGMAIIFLTIGQEIYFEGGLLEEAVQEGVRQGYDEGFLRKSIVRDPFDRVNTGDNTPAIIHYDIVKGDKLIVEVAPKGFGSENMSRIHMLKPSDGIEGAKEAIISTVDLAGGNACPPMVIGVGIGGSFEKAAFLSKKALLRDVGEHSTIPYVKALEIELLESINRLGIGPQGLGGRTTALGIHIEVFPTHIAGLPVAVNIGCHVTRHAKRTI
ncbi:putative L(+)-tartrate dehydratase subunit alpha [Petrocella atlantisensis]|uniref:Putative L(+)-tartrate dehydratase subunit alpha n=2 Tax=Petrocella atlantisensis TaxID=2173034 RepID=A0A3P7NXQ9_9FIRM|nr:fumarate hydratase [Petrocella atlantisensis]VDN47745.1 putative L(+)-tartrate dehydratase subunit alpha [Petrocella atlantisensis]